MNNNYKIFGLITSILRNDNPPEISKDFSNNVMREISLNNKKPIAGNYNNYINIAASVFFAVITAYSLIIFNQSETNVATVDILDDSFDKDGLIKRVIDDSDCNYDKKNNEEKNENCK